MFWRHGQNLATRHHGQTPMAEQHGQTPTTDSTVELSVLLRKTGRPGDLYPYSNSGDGSSVLAATRQLDFDGHGLAVLARPVTKS